MAEKEKPDSKARTYDSLRLFEQKAVDYVVERDHKRALKEALKNNMDFVPENGWREKNREAIARNENNTLEAVYDYSIVLAKSLEASNNSIPVKASSSDTGRQISGT